MMNILVQHPILLLVVGAVFIALSLAVGVLLGVCFTRRQNRGISAVSSEQSEQLAQTLLQWTNSLVDDVDQCREQMAVIQQGVLDADSDVQQSPEMFVDVMSQMIQANARMRQRLTAAEDTLSVQAKRIARTLSEARTDVLTGMPNRRLFDEELSRRYADFARHGTTFSLLLIDIDHFKRFNDRYGHLAGDEVLQSIARTIGHTLRETDLLARLGGEEFAVLFSATTGRDSHSAAERVRAAVAASTVQFEGQVLRVTISCGLAEPIEGEAETDLIRRSDMALYASKNAGRNCGHWHNGQCCVPLGSESDASTGTPPPFSAPPSDEELTEACNALRQRLLEVTAD